MEAREEPDGHASPAARRAPWRERVAFAVALALLGLMLAVSASTDRPDGGERGGRRLELVELIAQQQRRTAELAAEAAALEEQVTTYQSTVAEATGIPVDLQAEVDAASVAAGLTDVAGPGLTVTLRDSTLSPSDATGVDVNDLVIHEQDLQAVVNALWTGGAEVVSVNDQRVLTTSAIRCVGNILLMNGRVHPPPYVIAAIGDPEGLRSALDRDPAVARFREAVEQFEVGYETVAADQVRVPSFSGPPAVGMAQPVTTAEARTAQPVGTAEAA
jgi:uncharacterized protein YlxW (UPF0749 family)